MKINKYTADELYQLSKGNRKDKRPKKEHPFFDNRIMGVLRRSKYVSLVDEYKQPHKGKILYAVLSGAIWGIRGCGEKTVERICEWLCEEDIQLDDND